MVMSNPRWRDSKGRGYWRPSSEEYLPGVTTMIKPLDAEPGGLIGWATNTTAHAAVMQRERWQELSSSDEAEQLIKTHAREAQVVKRDVGKLAHDAIEAALRADLAGEARPTPPAKLAPYVTAMDRFCDETGWRPAHLEVTVINPQGNYAGTFDGVGKADGWWVMLDWKTGSVRDITMPAQLALYAAAPLILNDDGSETEWGAPDRLWLVQLAPDDYTVHEVAIPDPEQLTKMVQALHDINELARELPELISKLPTPARLPAE